MFTLISYVCISNNSNRVQQEKLELYNNSYCVQTWLALRYKDGCLFLCELLAKSARTIAHNIGPYDSSAHKSPEDPQQQLKSEQHFTGEAEYRKSQGTRDKQAEIYTV